MTKERSIWSGWGYLVRSIFDVANQRKEKSGSLVPIAAKKECHDVCLMITRNEKVHLTQRNKGRVVAFADQQSTNRRT